MARRIVILEDHLATCTDSRNDRLPSGRFVRNLALSLSGGALLTLVGAGVAAADEVGTTSDGAGTLGSGDATAVGNTSGTSTNQGIAPSAGASNPTVVTQTAVVPNVGIAVANTGGNVAIGNQSTNTNGPNTQTATGGAVATSNSGEVANVSNGSASIFTGDATAYGNQSQTTLNQSASGALGIITSQNAFVLNAGVAVANTGLNVAAGNVSTNTSGFVQTATNATGLATNSATATNASNGAATIATGSATATGNKSETWLDQTAGGTGDDDPGGLLVINQLGVVANLGAGIANSGANAAIGNTSTNETTDVIQDALVDPDIVSVLPGIIPPPLTTASNSLEAGNSSDGTATVRTGAASATGNDSSTNLTQASWGDPDEFGAIVSTQAAGVANVGIGAANTGINIAIGNASINDAEGDQAAAIDGAGDIASVLPVTASNSMSVTTTSDGEGTVRTGAADATGNDSDTTLSQSSNATVTPGSMGVLPNTQIAGVLNAGAGVANSGVNASIGNLAGQTGPNTAFLVQDASVDSTGGAITALGPITASNSAEVNTSSDGTAYVITGAASATGNTSATDLSQNLDTSVDGMGLVVAPQVAGVANLGLGVANSGINASIGNASQNTADADDVTADFGPLVDTTVLGTVTVSNSTSATNSSDGEACACTGAATASGNVSRSTLAQDLDLGAEDGFLVVPTTGVILNAGFGLANSGVNLAVGNISDNTATLDQDALLDPAAPALLVGPQTLANSGGASNSSDGGAKVGSGRANATGNLSESSLVQAAAIDGTGVVAPISSGIANAGAGAANSGVNLGVGNASTNVSNLVQTATGTGTVANQGEASNESDGTAQINDCEDEVTPPTPDVPEDEPGVPTLPRTGGAIETMAAVALMLLLAGFAAQGASRRFVA